MNGRFVGRLAAALCSAAARLRKDPLASALLLCAGLMLIAGFSWNPADDDNPHQQASEAAIQHFWAVYHGNDYDAIPQVQKELQRAIQDDPNNSTLYALLGAAHFWHIGEAARDAVPRDPALAQDMPDAVAFFSRSLQLDYYTQHPINFINDDHLPGYLGITTVHLGQMTNNPELIAKGDQTLDFAAYEFPEFNNFNRWAAHNTDAKDSPSYQKSLDSLWEGIDSCIGTNIDRTNPDLRPYLHLVTAVGRKKACWWQSELAPYSYEGYMLNLGNGLVKAGQVDAARVVYNNARLADNYATWPYRYVLEAIASSDLNARAGLYADGNSSNDPPLGVPNRGCSYCHAQVPETSNRARTSD